MSFEGVGYEVLQCKTVICFFVPFFNNILIAFPMSLIELIPDESITSFFNSPIFPNKEDY